MSGKRIVFTGGTGKAGRHAVPHLVAHGYSVLNVDLKPLDLISFPPGVVRRFHNVTKGTKNKDSILMVVIAGDTPSSEFTTESMREIERAGAMPARHRA